MILLILYSSPSHCFVLHLFENVYVASSVILCSSSSYCIHTQPYAYMAYLQNKLWTIETRHCLILLPINQFHPEALSYVSNAWAIHAHSSQCTVRGQHSFKK